MLKKINVDAITLPDVWYQTVYRCLENGRTFDVDRGSFANEHQRLEFDWITIHITNPDAGEPNGSIEPLIPTLPESCSISAPPTDVKYMEEEYLPYLLTDLEKENEAYTYGQRLHGAFMELEYYTDNLHLSIDDIKELFRLEIFKEVLVERPGHDKIFARTAVKVNQVKLVEWTYKNRGHRNNQMCMQVAQPTDVFLADPPCLRHIDTRIQDGILHFFPYFRSWDLYGGLPSNLAGLEILKQNMAANIGVKNGSIIATSKGLHLYSYVWELTEMLRGMTIEEAQRLGEL